MTKRYLTVAMLSTALLTGAAYAQTNQPNRAPAAMPSTASHEMMIQKGNWRASKLIGLNVYNQANENLGDINELILDKDGKVTAIVIGVGGFLGMGEHDIAVGMDKLKFVETAVGSSSAATTTTTTERSTTTTGAAPATTSTTAAPARTVSGDNDWVPDHAVMNATKDQLKAMKQFKYADYN